ncbi:MAG: metalloregulator ArsR/SmtB family transcription factor [Candidatus Zixiibacteriota bacterium]
MAYSKKDNFQKKQARLAELAKALGHPARIAILKTLAERNACVCGEIVKGLPLAQSTVSQHLKALKEAGLIKGEIEGPTSCYCIDGKTARELEALLEELLHALRNVNGDPTCRPARKRE